MDDKDLEDIKAGKGISKDITDNDAKSGNDLERRDRQIGIRFDLFGNAESSSPKKK